MSLSGGGAAPEEPPPRFRRLAFAAAAAPPALLFVFLTFAGWDSWAHPVIDYGREIYTPWRLAQGAELHRDVASIFGPFSQYFNAAVFRVFGSSIHTLTLTNLVLAAGFVSMIFVFVARTSGLAAASAAAMLLEQLFIFPVFQQMGTFNYLAPYSHEATHGVMLGSLSVVILAGAVRRAPFEPPPLAPFAAAGLCLGCVILTKPEMTLAAFAAAGTAVAFPLFCGAGRRRMAAAGAVLAAAAAIPPILSFLYFLRFSTPGEAFRRTFWAFLAVGGSGAASSDFYKLIMGLDKPGRHLGVQAVSLARLASYLAAAAALDVWFSRAKLRHLPWSLALGAYAAGLLYWRAPDDAWRHFTACFTHLVPAAAAALLAAAWRGRRDPAVFERWIPLALWAVFAAPLLGKIALKSTIVFYGFVLTMPAFMLFVSLLSGAVPAAMARRRPNGGRLFAALVFAALACVSLFHAEWLLRRHRWRTQVLESRGERLYMNRTDRNEFKDWLPEAVRKIEELSPEGSTLAVLPEGALFNYLTRRPNPTPYITVMPPEMTLFGEENVLKAYRAAPPDTILLLHSNTPIFGAGYFGETPAYGAKIMEWIRGEYETVWLPGPVPFTGDDYGLELLRRKADPAGTAGAAESSGGDPGSPDSPAGPDRADGPE